MTIKFGGKPTVQSRMDVAEKARGGRPVKTKDIAPVAKPQIKPTAGKGKVGVNLKWKF